MYHLADGETQLKKSVKTESEYVQLYSMYMVSRVNFSKEQQLLSNNFSKNNCLITLAKKENPLTLQCIYTYLFCPIKSLPVFKYLNIIDQLKV